MLTLEQELLYLNIRQAISEFPNEDLKTRYTNALRTFRMPYWDWAAPLPANEGLMPWSLQRQTIDIVIPNGTTTVDNPLHSYRFHPLVKEDFVRSPQVTRLPAHKESSGRLSLHDMENNTTRSKQP
jgi:tyrosinase